MVEQTVVTKVEESGADGFEELYQGCHLPALRLAAFLCGDRDQAEDIVADVLARTWVAWRRGRVQDGPAYVRRAVVNEVRSRGRRRSVEGRHFPRLGRPADEVVRDGSLDRSVVGALQHLPMHQRVPVVLRYLDDLSEASTAAVMGVPVGTVKSSVSRGLRRLREELGEEWDR